MIETMNKTIVRSVVAILVGAAFFSIGAFFFPDTKAVIGGIVFGTIVSLLNVYQLQRAIRRLAETNQNASLPLSMIGRMITIIIGAVLAFRFRVFMHPYGYCIGILLFPLATYVNQIMLHKKHMCKGGGKG